MSYVYSIEMMTYSFHSFCVCVCLHLCLSLSVSSCFVTMSCVFFIDILFLTRTSVYLCLSLSVS